MTVTASEPTVFVVEADAPLRDSVVALVQGAGLRAEAFPSAGDFLRAFEPHRPGCIVLDVRAPDGAGMNLQEHLRSQPYSPPILMLTDHCDVATAVRAMDHGAFDFIQRPVKGMLLLERIRAALALDAKRRADRAQHAHLRVRLDGLSKREREVLEIVVAGHSNKIVAERLGISTKTIEVHRAHAMKKMKARNLAGLVKMAVALEVTSATPE
ncbi:MAG: two-component system response regulator FixJ [Planctomycetota bacterium]|jgi:two-component system response regulator FixJ